MTTLSEYAVHRVIREFQERGERRLGIVKMYKTTYDVYRQLKDGTRGLDLQLPWAWFIHGPVVQYGLFSSETIQVGEPLSKARSDGEARFRIVTTGDLDASNLPTSPRTAVDEQVTKSVGEFLELTAKDVTVCIYDKYAPHEFERTFRGFARGFDEGDLDYDEKDIRILSQVRDEFPYQQFQDMVSIFTDWASMMIMVIQQYPKFLWDEAWVVKDFQELYGHRMSLDYHGNVGPLVKIWKNRYENLLRLFQMNLAEARTEFYVLAKQVPPTEPTAFRRAVLADLENVIGVG